MKRYRFWIISYWDYIVTVNNSNIIIESSLKPNGRPHWPIGRTLDELKEYYRIGYIDSQRGGRTIEEWVEHYGSVQALRAHDERNTIFRPHMEEL
jgi:hypothetical protein